MSHCIPLVHSKFTVTYIWLLLFKNVTASLWPFFKLVITEKRCLAQNASPSVCRASEGIQFEFQKMASLLSRSLWASGLLFTRTQLTEIAVSECSWMLLIGQKWDAAIGSDFDCQGIPNQSYVLEATSLVLSFQQTSLQYGLLCPTMKISRSAPLQRSMSHRHRHLSTEFIIFRIPSSTPNQNDTYNSAFLKCSRCN